MPIYSYQCIPCQHSFDLLIGVSQDKVELKCPACQSSQLKKVLTSFSVGGATPDTPCLDGAPCAPHACQSPGCCQH